MSKKKLPWIIVAIELVCIGLFFLTNSLIMNHRIAFIGGYSERDHWGAGLANVMSVTYSLFILAGIFSLTQIFVVPIFSKKFKNLNSRNQKEKATEDFLEGMGETK